MARAALLIPILFAWNAENALKNIHVLLLKTPELITTVIHFIEVQRTVALQQL